MKSMTKAFMLILLIVFTNSYSQTLNWSTNYGGTIDHYAKALTVDADNNVYVTGYRWGSFKEYATVKYNSSGAYQWDIGYGSIYGHAYSSSIASYPYNDPYAFVSITGTRKTISNYECRTISYKSDRTELWNTGFSVGTGDFYGMQVRVDPAGNTYVCGYGYNGSNFDYFVLKYDMYGNPSGDWSDMGHGVGVRIFDGTAHGNDYGYGLAISGGYTFITGICQSTAGYVISTIAYDFYGNLLWVSDPYFAGVSSNFDVVNPIEADWFTGVYVTGENDGRIVTIKYNLTNGRIDWVHNDYDGLGRSIALYPKGVGKTHNHTNDVFVTGDIIDGFTKGSLTINYDDDGTELWYRKNLDDLQLSESYALAVDAYENSYVTGYLQKPAKEPDYLIIKYNSNGTQEWYLDYTAGYGVDKANCIAIDNNRNVDVSGTCVISYIPNFVTIQYGQDGPNNLRAIGSNSSQPVPKEYALGQNYPNPFNPGTNINYAIPQNGYVTLKVFDILGREVATLVNEYKSAGFYTTQFDASELASGMYFYKMDSRDFRDVKKMVLVR